MAKRSRISILREEYRRYGLRWECIRRNPHYIKDYNDYVIGFNKVKLPKAIAFFKEKQNKIFRDKYGLRVPVAPSVSFYEQYELVKSDVCKYLADELNQIAENSVLLSSVEYGGKYPALFCENIVRDFRRNNLGVIGLTVEQSKSKAQEKFGDILGIKTVKAIIDFNTPLPKVIRDMEFLIKSFYAVEIREQKKRNRRFRLGEDMDKDKEYLLIYDLKSKGGLSFKDIAKRLYPKEYKKASKNVSTGKEWTEKERKYKKALEQTKDTDKAYRLAYGSGDEKASNKVIQMVLDRFYAIKPWVERDHKEIR